MNPPIIESEKGGREALLEAAKFMLIAARTAPKTAGVDDFLTSVVYGQHKDIIADKTDKIGEERKIGGFRRDVRNVRDSEAVVSARDAEQLS